jgi:flagellar motor protein MotB
VVVLPSQGGAAVIGARRDSETGEAEIWPVIADSFLGILAVIVFLFAGLSPPPDPGKEQFLKALTARFDGDKRAGDLLDFEVDSARVRLVYSADRLSFAQCEWSLAQGPAEMLRSHLRLFTANAPMIRDITIDGHADRDSAASCAHLQPYRDNVQLSQNRARAVLNVLLGLDATQAAGLDDLLWKREGPAPPDGLEFLYDLARTGKLRVAGLGASTPLNAQDPKDPKNRRVELIISLHVRAA